MAKMVHCAYDEDEYMYPKLGESQMKYDSRMEELRKKRGARMTPEIKRQVSELMTLLNLEESTL